MHTEMGDPDKNDDVDVDVGEDDVLLEEIPEETVVLPETVNSDNVGDVSVEINVEELVAELEASHDDDADQKLEIKKRLDAIQEEKLASEEFEDTYNIDLNEED